MTISLWIQYYYILCMFCQGFVVIYVEDVPIGTSSTGNLFVFIVVNKLIGARVRIDKDWHSILHY